MQHIQNPSTSMEAHVLVRFLLLCAVLFVVSFTAHAHIDFALLRDVICEYETQGHPTPDSARGASDEIGRCQLRPGTARQMGFKGTLDMLQIGMVSEYFALKYLRYCSRRLHTHNPAKLAHCYNGGPNLPWEGIGQARRYAAAVVARYDKVKRSRLTAQIVPRKGAWL